MSGAPHLIEAAGHGQAQAGETAPVEQLRIVWSIGRGGREPASDRSARLEWRIADGQAVATLQRDEADAPEAVVARGPVARLVQDEEAGLDHLEVEGLLWITLSRRQRGQPRLLFARTTVLARLGVAGGRYAAPRLIL